MSPIDDDIVSHFSSFLGYQTITKILYIPHFGYGFFVSTWLKHGLLIIFIFYYIRTRNNISTGSFFIPTTGNPHSSEEIFCRSCRYKM